MSSGAICLGATKMPQIPLSEAIQQLRDELREAIVEGADKDIVFTPNSVDMTFRSAFARRRR